MIDWMFLVFSVFASVYMLYLAVAFARDATLFWRDGFRQMSCACWAGCLLSTIALGCTLAAIRIVWWSL